MKSKKEKQDEVEFLKGELAEATNLVVVKFKGLTVEQDGELRRKVREAASKYRVVKNRLLNVASEGTPVADLRDSFEGSTAIAWNSTDPVGLAKALSNYAKEHPIFEFKAGIVDGRVVDISTLVAIGALPSFKELIAKLLFLVNAPAQQIATGVNAVARNMAVALNQAVEQNKFS